jgi:hypothetical protein
MYLGLGACATLLRVTTANAKPVVVVHSLHKTTQRMYAGTSKTRRSDAVCAILTGKGAIVRCEPYREACNRCSNGADTWPFGRGPPEAYLLIGSDTVAVDIALGSVMKVSLAGEMLRQVGRYVLARQRRLCPGRTHRTKLELGPFD